MIRSIVLKGKRIEYELTRKNVKNINLRIKPDLSISVSASNRVAAAEIEKFMHLKEDVILKALDRFSQNAAETAAPQYISGETVSVLGRDYELCVEKSTKNAVLFEENRIVLRVKDTEDTELKRRTLDKWLKERCFETVAESCVRIYPIFEKQVAAFPEIRIRTMSSKWGSCMPKKGVLTFSTNLVAAPKECIDYVVAHEFTHFLHPDHSKSFYASLESVCPDWKRLKKSVNSYRVIRK